MMDDSNTIQDETKFEEASTRTEQILANIWAQLLGASRVDINTDFFKMGGTSLLGVQMMSRAQSEGIRISPRIFAIHRTVKQIAAEADSMDFDSQSQTSGEVKLLPLQQRILESVWSGNPGYNVFGMMYQTFDPIDPDVLRRTFEVLVDQHDVLRTRFENTPSGWKQIISNDIFFEPLLQKDFSSVPEDDFDQKTKEAIKELRESLHIENGPLFRAILIDAGEGRWKRIGFIGSALVMDLMSRAIFIGDLQLAYRFLEKGEEVPFPPKTTRYQEWADWVVSYADSGTMDHELNYWLSLAEKEYPALPNNDAPTGNYASSISTLSEGDTSELIKNVNTIVSSSYSVDIYDVLYAAFAYAYSKWLGQSRVLFTVSGHGREDWINRMDLSRTLGAFRSVYPVCLEIPDEESVEDTFSTVRRQVEQIPNRGFGYDVLRCFHKDRLARAKLEKIRSSDVFFAYNGNFDVDRKATQRWDPIANLANGNQILRTESGERLYKLAVAVSIRKCKLIIRCTYSKDLFESSAVDQLTHDFAENVRKLSSSPVIKEKMTTY